MAIGLLTLHCLQMLSDRVAKKMLVPTARLPIKEYLIPPPKGPIVDLPVDQVMKMLLSVHCDGDWSSSFEKHFPKRKR